VFGKLNTDENPGTAQRFRVLSIPTLILFKNGEPVDTLVGAAPRPRIEGMLRRHLA
jgi:thioredoxin 1